MDLSLIHTSTRYEKERTLDAEKWTKRVLLSRLYREAPSWGSH
jgi:hypothetical protein